MLGRTKRGPTRRLMLLSLVVAALLAGCTSSGSSGATGTSGPSSPLTTVTVTTLIAGTVPPYSAKRNAREDATILSCANHGAGGWTLRGRVTNTASKPRGYSIVVDFITTSGDTVRATKLVTVPSVAPHQTRDWSAGGAAPGETGLACVIRQVLWT